MVKGISQARTSASVATARSANASPSYTPAHTSAGSVAPNAVTTPAPPTSMSTTQKVLVAFVAAAAAMAAGLAMWAATPPRPMPQRHIVVSATAGEVHLPCRGGTCVRPVTQVELRAFDDGVVLLRELNEPPGMHLVPGQEVTVYRDPLGNLTLSKGTTYRLLNATVTSLMAGGLAAAAARGALAAAARVRRRRGRG